MKGKQCKFFGMMVIVAFLSSLSLFASAETQAVKIAVFDARLAIFSSAVAQNELKMLEQSADFISLKAKYESSNADLQAMVKEAETKRLTWSPEELAEYKKQMSYVKADVDLVVQKITSEQSQLEQRVFNELAQYVEPALKEIINEEGVDILLRAESILHMRSPETSITAKVASRIDAKYNAKPESE